MTSKRRKPELNRKHVFQPDRWPAWRRALNRILYTEGPRPMTELVARVEELVPPDKALHHTTRQREKSGAATSRNTMEQDTRSGQRSMVFSGIHSSVQTGFYERWITDDDITMIGLGEAGRLYYEERRAQGHQSASVQRSGEGTEGTN